jgi:hypothetical protein
MGYFLQVPIKEELTLASSTQKGRPHLLIVIRKKRPSVSLLLRALYFCPLIPLIYRIPEPDSVKPFIAARAAV